MIFSCHPIEANWNVALYLAPTTHCSPKVYDVQTVHGYCNIVTDFSILVLPIVPGKLVKFAFACLDHVKSPVVSSFIPLFAHRYAPRHVE